jgi:hypothetical protein
MSIATAPEMHLAFQWIIQPLNWKCKVYYARIPQWLSKGGYMAVKLAFVMVALTIATIGLSAAEIPNLTGNWTGSFKGYEKNAGYLDENKTGSLNIVISEQTGRLFTGTFTENSSLTQKNQGNWTEGFSGVIGLDNRTLYLAEYDKGYDIGTLLSNDAFELVYLEDGANAGAYIDTFYRVE